MAVANERITQEPLSAGAATAPLKGTDETLHLQRNAAEAELQRLQAERDALLANSGDVLARRGAAIDAKSLMPDLDARKRQVSEQTRNARLQENYLESSAQRAETTIGELEKQVQEKEAELRELNNLVLLRERAIKDRVAKLPLTLKGIGIHLRSIGASLQKAWSEIRNPSSLAYEIPESLDARLYNAASDQINSEIAKNNPKAADKLDAWDYGRGTDLEAEIAQMKEQIDSWQQRIRTLQQDAQEYRRNRYDLEAVQAQLESDYARLETSSRDDTPEAQALADKQKALSDQIEANEQKLEKARQDEADHWDAMVNEFYGDTELMKLVPMKDETQNRLQYEKNKNRTPDQAAQDLADAQAKIAAENPDGPTPIDMNRLAEINEDPALRGIAERSPLGRAVEIRRDTADASIVFGRLVRFTESVVERYRVMGEIASQPNASRADVLKMVFDEMGPELIQHMLRYREQAYAEAGALEGSDLGAATAGQKDAMVVASNVKIEVVGSGMDENNNPLGAYALAERYARVCRDRASMGDEKYWMKKAAAVEQVLRKADTASDRFVAAQKKARELAEKNLKGMMKANFKTDTDRTVMEILLRAGQDTKDWSSLSPEDLKIVTQREYADVLEQANRVLENAQKWEEYTQDPDALATEMALAMLDGEEEIARYDSRLAEAKAVVSAHRAELRTLQADSKYFEDHLWRDTKLEKKPLTKKQEKTRAEFAAKIAQVKELLRLDEDGVTAIEENKKLVETNLRNALREIRADLPLEMQGKKVFGEIGRNRALSELAEVYEIAVLSGKPNTTYEVGGKTYQLDAGVVDADAMRKEFDARVKEIVAEEKAKAAAETEAAARVREAVEAYDGSTAQYRNALDKLQKLPRESLETPSAELLKVLVDMGINHVDRLGARVEELQDDPNGLDAARALAPVVRAIGEASDSPQVQQMMRVYARALETKV